MNIDLLISQLAGNVVAKTGITPKQAKEIIYHVVALPSEDIQKTLKLSELGDIILINRKTAAEDDSAFAGAIKIPYEAVVKFNVGNTSKKLTFRDLEKAKRQPGKHYEWSELEHMITLGGLEGGSDTPVRRPKKQSGTVKPELPGNHDIQMQA